MSGYAGIFHFDGAPVNSAWLGVMADFLSARGPDGREIQASGSAGFCHTLLRTSAGTDGRAQILSLDNGAVWIAGDVRLDDRETLIAQLSATSGDLKKAGAAELVLHAWAAWGEACVEHLLGDFSFVIWDSRRKHVFAARDQLGVKPLYYARIGPCLIVSNSLDCIRRVPIVPSDLNEQAIGDYLVFGENKDPATTFFSAIQALPVARRMTATPDGIRTDRYWTMPIDEPLFYQRAGDYVDQFRDLLQTAVRDRLPDGPLGVLMSGGLDSPAIAANAVQLGAAVTAFTCVYDRLIPDRERHFAGLVAAHLGIPIRFIVRDDEQYGWEPGAAPIHTPEPCGDPLGIAASALIDSTLQAHARVFFCGYGADDAFRYEWKPYVSHLFGQRKWARLCAAIASDFLAQPRIPVLGRLPRIRADKRSVHSGVFYESSFPPWIDQDFAARLKLAERWEQLCDNAAPSHPTHPEGFAVLNWDVSPVAPGDGGDHPIEFRSPFWDLRLQRFLLRVPPVPWCRNKQLLRDGLRGLLPDSIRLRPKTPLAGLPYIEQASGLAEPVLPPVPVIDRCLNSSLLPAWPGRNRKELDNLLSVIGLRYWVLGI